MHRIATMSALAALLVGLPLVEALAGQKCCRNGRGVYFYAPPPSPYEAWLAYFNAQAAIAGARRAARANYYVATGRPLPYRYFGPPTNTYAERYALEPYSYFSCPLARRGDGICAEADFFQR